MNQPYPYQAVGHDASISAAPGEEPGTVTVEIVVGEHAETRITMWAEDFNRMALAADGHTWTDVTEYGDRHSRYQCTHCPATKTVEHTPREDQP